MIIGAARAEECRVHDTHQGFHTFHKEETQEPYGSFEVFWDDGDISVRSEPGWYWWTRLPGVDPEDEATGPFSTSRNAREDADPWAPEFD